MKTFTYLLIGGLFLSLFAICTPSKLQAQSRLDSLQTALKQSPKDTNRVKILTDLWRMVAGKDLDQAKQYAQEIVALSEELGFVKGLGHGYQRLGVAYYHLSEEKKSREAYKKALVIFRSPDARNKGLEGVILFNLGLGFKSSGQYDSTERYFALAHEVFEEVGTAVQRGAVLDGLSGMHYEQGKYESSLENALLAAREFEEAGDTLRLADASMKIGQAYEQIKNYPAALDNYRKCLSMYRKYNDIQFELHILKLIGTIYANLDQRDSSMFYFEQGLTLLQKYPFKHLSVEFQLSIGNEYLDGKQYVEALKKYEAVLPLAQELNTPAYLIPLYQNISLCRYHLKRGFGITERPWLEALALAEENKSLGYLPQIHKELSVFYKENGLLEKALDHFYDHQSLKDSLMDEETRDKIAELQALYESEKKDRELERKESEIKILQQEAEIDQLNQQLLIGGIVLSLLLMLAIFIGYRQKIQRDRLIHAQEKQAYEQELLFNKKELATHTLHLVQKSDLLEELQAQMESTRKAGGDAKKELSGMIQLIKSDKHVEQDWQNFKMYFDKVHEDFDKNLRRKTQDLSQNEFRLAALMKMDLSTKEIASILNISPDSVHKSRYRLKKRLELGAEENLREYILSV